MANNTQKKKQGSEQKARAAEIRAVFAKHNFYTGGFSPLELRTTLEDLGPTYVKIGQIMSSRVDMLPEKYCKELEKLRANVKPLETEVVRGVIENELGKKIEEVFSEFVDEPLGSASIGQVHKAKLSDGTEVVVKVQRPLIADMMRSDFVMLKKIASTIKMVREKDEGEEEKIDLLAVIEEMEKVTEEELDFRVEAENTIFFKENCIEDEEKVSCPTIFPELTTERMMTMTFVEGYSVSQKDHLIMDGYDPDAIGTAILDNYVHQVLDVATFHADPHQGNIIISSGVPYWIDFGMIGRLTEDNIRCLEDLLLAVIELDKEALIDAVLSMGAASPKTDRGRLAEDLDGMIRRYMSVHNLDDLDTAVLLEDVSDIMSNNHIRIPGEYTMLIRSIATIEGVIEQLCPTLNLFSILKEKIMERVKKQLDPKQKMIDFGRDAMSFGKRAAKIPSLTYDALNNVVNGKTRINVELSGYRDMMQEKTELVKIILLAVFACVIFIGSCILCTTPIRPQTSDGMPVLAAAGFIFSIALGIYSIRRITKKQEKK